MEKLVKGVHAFQEEVFRSERALFKRLAEGQTPETLFITCSDSRINPNQLTGTDPGELFILRTAGNLVPSSNEHPSGEAATIEYAVSVLEVEDIIVCGHSLCGAIDALLDPSKTERLPNVRSWLAHAHETKQIVDTSYPGLSESALVSVAVQENVLVQIEHLKKMPCVAERIAAGTLGLHAWVYRIESGDVFAYDPNAGQYVHLNEEVARAGVKSRGNRAIRPI